MRSCLGGASRCSSPPYFSTMLRFCVSLNFSFFSLNSRARISSLVGSACRFTSAPFSYASHANTAKRGFYWFIGESGPAALCQPSLLLLRNSPNCHNKNLPSPPTTKKAHLTLSLGDVLCISRPSYKVVSTVRHPASTRCFRCGA